MYKLFAGHELVTREFLSAAGFRSTDPSSQDHWLLTKEPIGLIDRLWITVDFQKPIMLHLNYTTIKTDPTIGYIMELLTVLDIPLLDVGKEAP